MTTKKFVSEEIKKIKVGSLARKYEITESYVRMILKGERERNTELSQKVLKDANDMLEIVERETTIN